ncbi:hypothetical protein U0070_007820 [Myodes glareolus]|uniref:Uncharacterized protein n=1 Tax=Myodes glareolus TaxID=447135 RepID=A0AAW0JJ21_MYOGA
MEEGPNFDQAMFPVMETFEINDPIPKKRTRGAFCMVVIAIHLTLLTAAATLLFVIELFRMKGERGSPGVPGPQGPPGIKGEAGE